MKRLAVIVVALLAVAAVGYALMSRQQTPEDIFLDLPRPTADDASVAPDIQVSTISLPISLPHSTLLSWGEQKVPKVVNGNAPVKNFGPAIQNRASWDLARTPLTSGAVDGRLVVSSKIQGDLKVNGKIEPVGGKLGNLLGDLKPSKSYQQTVDVSVGLNIKMQPKIQSDWRIIPGLDAKANVQNATAKIAGLFDLPLKKFLQPRLTEIVEKNESQIAASIRKSDAIEQSARKTWNDLCTPIPISSGDGMPPLSLRVTPLAFFAGQPVIGSEKSTINLGLDAILRIVPQTVPVEPCPAFNNILAIGERPGGTTSISVDAEIDYETLNIVLEALRSDRPESATGEDSLSFEEITLSPFGSKILVAAKGAFKIKQMLGATVRGTVYLSADPVLSDDGKRLTFKDVKLHEASRVELAKLSLPVVNAIEPFIDEKLRKLQVDLTPELNNAKRAADQAASGLMGKPGGLTFTNATVDSVSARNLWHDVNGIFVRMSADGRFAADVSIQR